MPVLASTFLESGTTSGSDCLFEVDVNVPDTDFYQIAIANRGTITFAKSDLESNGWEADLSIGS
jgi:hypothetical protein